jgi:hypothetical protein
MGLRSRQTSSQNAHYIQARLAVAFIIILKTEPTRLDQFHLGMKLALLRDEYLSPFAVIIRFFTSIRVINNARNGVCDEECWLVGEGVKSAFSC